jgi:hypothetical protein
MSESQEEGPVEAPRPAAGAPPARSPLNLRLGLAFFGFVVSVAGAITLAAHHVPALLVTVMVLIAVTALIDIIIVLRRKFRGE